MSVLMEEMYLEKLKFHKWYIPNVAKAFEIGKLLSSKASETKDTWVHDCRDKRSGKTVIMKIIKRSMRKNLLQDLCTQLFELQQLYDKLENKFNLGTIKCFDCELEKDGEVNKIVVRLVMDKYNGTLRSLIQSGQRIKPQEYIEQVKYFSLMMFELEGRNTSHKNLSINSIYYTFDSSSRIVWKLFGFASLLWDAAEGSLMYASPEEKFSLSRFETSLSSSAYDLDYFKVDTYNLGIVLIELLVMKEMGKWGFQLDGGMGDDPKRKEEYTNQAQLNDMIASNAEYLRLHGFLLGLLKTMVHVNPRKRDRFARVVSVLHEGLKLKLLAYQLDPIGKDDHFESVSSEVVEKQQNELKQKDEELAKLKEQLRQQQSIIEIQRNQIEKIENSMGVMQSTLRVHTENKVDQEFKIIKTNADANKALPFDPKIRKQLNAKEKCQLRRIKKHDEGTLREMKATFGSILAAMKHFKPNAVNRATMTMWMAGNSTFSKYHSFFKAAVKDAGTSNSSDAIFTVISLLFNSKTDINKIFELVYQDKVLKEHFLRFLRLFKPSLLSAFAKYFQFPDYDTLIIFFKKAFAGKDTEIQQELFRITLEFTKTRLFPPPYDRLQQELQAHYDFILKEDCQIQTTVHEKLEQYLEKNVTEKSDFLIRYQEISPRMVIIKKFKSFLSREMFKEADSFIESSFIAGFDKEQKKQIYHVEPEIIAMQFQKYDQPDIATKYIQKIEDIPSACQQLARMDQLDLAIEYATQSKNIEALEKVKLITKDAGVLSAIEATISRLELEQKYTTGLGKFFKRF